MAKGPEGEKGRIVWGYKIKYALPPDDESELNPNRTHLECEHDWKVKQTRVGQHTELEQSIHTRCGLADFRKLQCRYCKDEMTDTGTCRCY